MKKRTSISRLAVIAGVGTVAVSMLLTATKFRKGFVHVSSQCSGAIEGHDFAERGTTA